MKKLLIFFVIIVGIIGLVIGGYKVMQKVEHHKMVEIVYSKEVKKIIEDDLKYFDENALTEHGFIKSYKIDDTTIEHNPMGGINFEIYVNSNESLIVYFGLEKNNSTGKIEYSGGGYSKEVKRLIGKGE